MCACVCNQQYFLFVQKPLNIISACCSAGTRCGHYYAELLFQPHPPLDNESQNISINTSKAALWKKRQTMHSDTYLNVLFVCYCFCLPCLVCQCRKFHLVLKCKSCEAQGHPQRENNGQRPAEEQTLPLNQIKRH